MARNSHGWATLARPGDGIPGLNSVHHSRTGTGTVWHKAGPRGSAHRWRVTVIYPDGTVRQGNGRNSEAAWAGVAGKDGG